jgi:hypothetical protein
MQAILLIREHDASYKALCLALEEVFFSLNLISVLFLEAEYLFIFHLVVASIVLFVPFLYLRLF